MDQVHIIWIGPIDFNLKTQLDIDHASMGFSLPDNPEE